MIISTDRSMPAKPFQFGLRALFIGIALLGMLLAIMVRLDPVWSVALAWLLLLVAAHVAGNVWGTRAGAARTPSPAPDDAECPAATATVEFAPATRLRDSSRLTRGMLATALAGATLGAIGGTTTIMHLYHNTVSYLGTTIASISGAGLGAMLGFLASSFLGIASRALREAADDPARPRARR